MCSYSCIIFFLGGVYAEKYIYVDVSNTNPNPDGSISNPYPSIQQAIWSIEKVEEIVVSVEGGIYIENVGFGPSAKIPCYIKIIGAGKGKPVIIRPKDPVEPAIHIVGYYFDGKVVSEIRNITFEGPGTIGIKVEGFLGEGEVKIHTCRFIDGEGGFLNTAIHVEESISVDGKLSINHNEFLNIGSPTIYMQDSGYPKTGIDISNNLFYKGELGIYAQDSCVRVYNNTFFDFYIALVFDPSFFEKPGGIIYQDLKNYVYFINNIIYKPKNCGIIVQNISSTVYKDPIRIIYNDIYTDDYAKTKQIDPEANVLYANNINKDPLFKDLTIPDLHLSPGSPCINAGSPYIKDKDGTTSDMGAYGGPNSL